jgi:hypothetical protein
MPEAICYDHKVQGMFFLIVGVISTQNIIELYIETLHKVRPLFTLS